MVSTCFSKGTAQYCAKLCINSGWVSFDAKLGVFLAKGTAGVARVVTLFSNETCSCIPQSVRDCYHIYTSSKDEHRQLCS